MTPTEKLAELIDGAWKIIITTRVPNERAYVEYEFDSDDQAVLLTALRASTDRACVAPSDPFGIALILKDQTAELERLREEIAWKAAIIKAADTEMERLRGLCREAGVEPTVSSGS